MRCCAIFPQPPVFLFQPADPFGQGLQLLLKGGKFHPDRVGHVDLVEVGGDPDAVQLDDLGGDADGGGVGRDFLEDDRTGGNLGVIRRW